jgi:hypothetical protein
MITRLALLVLAVFALLLTDAPEAAACSGGDPRFETLDLQLVRLSNFDNAMIVVGSVVNIDDSRYSGIIRVEQYLFGHGGEYLLIANETVVQQIHNERDRFWLECRPPLQLPPLYQTKIFFLIPNGNGSYYSENLYPFAQSQNTATFTTSNQSSVDNTEIRETTSFNLETISGYISHFFGQSPSQPQVRPYPNVAPAMVRTRNGNHYLLPVDGGTPVPIPPERLLEYTRPPGCATPPCDAISPNGLDVVALGTIDVQTYNDVPAYWSDGANFVSLHEAYGTAVLVSPTSDTFALWQEERLAVYALYYPDLGFTDATRPYDPPTLVNEVVLSSQRPPIITQQFSPGAAAWTPDGRMLAYTDSNGLWLWDAFTEGVSRRLIVPRLNNSDDPLPYARHFSSGGRYLAVQQGERRYTLDVINLDEYPDGIVSPDERRLLAFDTRSSSFDPILYYLSRQGRARDVTNTWISNLRQVEWDGNYRFLHAICYEAGFYYVDETEREWRDTWCQVSSTTLDRSRSSELKAEGYAFDYDPVTDSLATIIDKTRITLNGIEYDLEPYIDSPIVDIQWLPPLFYYEE